VQLCELLAPRQPAPVLIDKGSRQQGLARPTMVKQVKDQQGWQLLDSPYERDGSSLQKHAAHHHLQAK